MTEPHFDDGRPVGNMPVDGEREAVDRAIEFMRHNGLCAFIGGYGYCSCGRDDAEAALRSTLALPTAEMRIEEDDGEEDGYEAMVFSAHLPMRTIAFIYRDGGPRLAGGIYRITRVRSSTPQDHEDFFSPPDHTCPLCGQEEPS